VRRTISLRAAAAAVAAALATGLAACGGAQVVTQQKSPTPIHIGAIFNLTGSQAPLDGPSLDGARLAVDRINAAGGLLGRRVELLERDGQTDPALVRYDAENLAALKVTAIIGLSDTDQVLAGAPVAARAGIPFVTSGATSPLLPAQVPEWLFLACFGDNVQAAAGAEYAADWLGARTAAILFDKDMEYTRLLQRYFGQSFSAQGGTIVLRAGFHSGEHDIAKLLAPPGGRNGDEGDDAARALPLRRAPSSSSSPRAPTTPGRWCASCARPVTASPSWAATATTTRRSSRRPGRPAAACISPPTPPSVWRTAPSPCASSPPGTARPTAGPRERVCRPRLRRRQPGRHGDPAGEVRGPREGARCVAGDARLRRRLGRPELR